MIHNLNTQKGRNKYVEAMSYKEELKSKIEELTDKIDSYELEESDYSEQYDDMLDNCYEGVFDMLPSTILLRCDPIMYGIGLTEYVDSIELTEVDEYNDLVEELEELEEGLEELENED